MDFEVYDGYFWQGEKVRLRALQVEDAVKKMREYTDSEGRSYIQYGMDLPPVSKEAYLEGLKPLCDFKDTSKYLIFSIVTLADECVGWLNMHTRNQRQGTFGFSVSVFREYQRNGYAEEALRILLRYGFFEQRFQKCNSECLDVNEGSIRLHEKVGFVEEGRRRRMVYLNGEFRDTALFGLLKEEFEENERQRG